MINVEPLLVEAFTGPNAEEPTLDVRIPEGLADGQTIRLRGKGSPGIGGGEAGNALITVSVQPHRYFRREGDDILLDLPISLDEAVLRAKVEAPTIAGPVSPEGREQRTGSAPARARCPERRPAHPAQDRRPARDRPRT